jgi:prophage regulatory protein
MRVLSYDELRTEKGIRFSQQWIRKLVKEDRFPAPVSLGEATRGFIETEVDNWIAERIRERDAAA